MVCLACLLSGCVQSPAKDECAADGCTQQPSQVDCALPPLSVAEVREVAEAFLRNRGLQPRLAETRVSALDCDYEYEESERLDSFGIGVIVQINRERKVVDFRGSH